MEDPRQIIQLEREASRRRLSAHVRTLRTDAVKTMSAAPLATIGAGAAAGALAGRALAAPRCAKGEAPKRSSRLAGAVRIATLGRFLLALD